MMELDFAIESALWQGLPGAQELGQTILGKAAALSGKALHPDAEISIVLCDDAAIRALNKQWRKIDKATNVLSFPAGDMNNLARSPLLGDIILSFETLEREALAEGKTMADHYCHLIVHGFLHLIGFDHETEAEAEEMEALEIRILAAQGIANPYAEPEPGAGQ